MKAKQGPGTWIGLAQNLRIKDFSRENDNGNSRATVQEERAEYSLILQEEQAGTKLASSVPHPQNLMAEVRASAFDSAHHF